MSKNIFTGTSYATTRLINLQDKELDCGLHTYYKVVRSETFAPLFHLPQIYAFLPKVSSPYFATRDPLQYMQPEKIPKLLKTKVKRKSKTPRNVFLSPHNTKDLF